MQLVNTLCWVKHYAGNLSREQYIVRSTLEFDVDTMKSMGGTKASCPPKPRANPLIDEILSDEMDTAASWEWMRRTPRRVEQAQAFKRMPTPANGDVRVSRVGGCVEI
jgi:hypothetical protein